MIFQDLGVGMGEGVGVSGRIESRQPQSPKTATHTRILNSL